MTTTETNTEGVAPAEATAPPGEVAKSNEEAAEARRAFERQKTVWKYLAMFMAGFRQYGWHHPEPRRSLKQAHDELTATLVGEEATVWWDVSPYAIMFDGNPVWEPDRPPFDRVPFQLFGDGLRRLQVRTGITEEELGDLVALLVKDPSSGLGPDDDVINGIWDRRFKFVTYMAVDNLAEGDAAERDAFQRDCDELVAALVARARLGENGWPGEVNERDAYAPPESLCNVMDEAAKIALDEGTRARLAASADISSDLWTERYVDAFAQGWLEAIATGDAALVSGALGEWTAEQVALRRRGLAFGMYNALRSVLSAQGNSAASRDLERQVAKIMFPEAALRGVMSQLVEEAAGKAPGDLPALEPAVVSGLIAAFDQIESDKLFTEACEWMEGCPVESLRPAILSYVKKWVAGHEAELGPRIAQGSSGVALALVQLVAELGTPAAQQALSAAFENPNVPVRIEALTKLPNASAERVGEELRKLMNDAAAEVRLEVLGVVRRLQVKAAGPALALRVQGAAFDKLTMDERKAALSTLQVLNPNRAETIAIELLAQTRLIPRRPKEESRAVAAEVLGETSSSQAALDATRKFGKRRWYNTAVVRTAADKAAVAIAQRIEQRAASGSMAQLTSGRPSKSK